MQRNSHEKRILQGNLYRKENSTFFYSEFDKKEASITLIPIFRQAVLLYPH